MFDLQDMQTYIGIAARWHDLALLQVSRRAVKYGTPEYVLLDRMVDRNCGMPVSFGPRLENGMFLSQIRRFNSKG